MSECGNAKAQAHRAERASNKMMHRANKNRPMVDEKPKVKVAIGPRGNVMTKGIADGN